MNVTNHQEWMVASPVPYQIGETDLLKFTQEESLLFFLKKQAGEPSQVTTVAEPMPAASPDQLAETLTSDTLRIGYIAVASCRREPASCTHQSMQRSQQGETDVSNCCAFDRDGEPDPNSRRSEATTVCHDEPAGDRTWAVDRAGRTHKDAASLQR